MHEPQLVAMTTCHECHSNAAGQRTESLTHLWTQRGRLIQELLVTVIAFFENRFKFVAVGSQGQRKLAAGFAFAEVM